MPDLQTELSKVINEWEAPMQTTTPTQSVEATTNMSRSTFEFVQQNPGLTRRVVVNHLATRGFKATSTTSLLTQMLRSGLIKLVDERLFATQKNYRPLKLYVARNPVHKRANATQRQAHAEPAATVTPPRPTSKDLLASLSISEARALYDELYKIFNSKN